MSEIQLAHLMPMPRSVASGGAVCSARAGLSMSFAKGTHPRVEASLARMGRRLGRRHHQPFHLDFGSGDPDRLPLRLAIDRPGAAVPLPDMDETYRLDVSPQGVEIAAPTEIGALRAVQTLFQLFFVDRATWHLPVTVVEDGPRFAWRGMLLDVSRHFMGAADVLRLLDAMEMAKLNVLHLHLTDDQGFRLECETWPKLHEVGSAGAYFTKAEMRGLIDAASDRGIRIVPEFGLPGHSIAWQVAYPELAAADPPPSKVGELEGYFSPGIDPVREGTYTFIDRLVEEMAALFPDPYFHIGGDEVNGKAWHENPEISAFMAERGFRRSADLQAHFTSRFAKIVAAHGKIAVGWEEVLHGEVADDVIIHLWDKGTYAPELARHPVLTSWNYYLDHQQPSDWLYGKDPLDFSLKDGSNSGSLNVLGAEVTNWSETINGETLDMRTWPRTCAIAERLWSQRDYCDGRGRDSLRVRMEARSQELEAAGMLHRARCAAFFADQFEGEVAAALVTEFADLLQPAAYPFFRRRRAILERALPKLFPLRHEDRYSNVDRLVDNLNPESEIAWAFREDAGRFSDTRDPALAVSLAKQLSDWGELAVRVRTEISASHPLMKEGLGRLARGVLQVSAVGAYAVEALAANDTISGLSAWWLTRRLNKYQYETFYLDADVMGRVARDFKKPDVINMHHIAIYPGVAHLLRAAKGERE